MITITAGAATKKRLTTTTTATNVATRTLMAAATNAGTATLSARLFSSSASAVQGLYHSPSSTSCLFSSVVNRRINNVDLGLRSRGFAKATSPVFFASPPQQAFGDDYINKYSDKLNKLAKSQGFNSAEEMLQKRKEEELEMRKKALAQAKASRPTTSAKATITSNAQESSAQTSSTTNTKSSSDKPRLDQIVNLELMRKESAERIGAIWNEHHATKTGLSGVMEAKFYNALQERARKYPLFILPLPRESGVEFFFLQITGPQIYFTPLLEYKTKLEKARAHLVLTHYDDLAEEKGIVLMNGDICLGTLTSEEARLLVYQMQLFYVTGSERKKALLETFHGNPNGFDFQQLIDEMEKLD
ncbi:ATP synthase mitochondrial F1 complex assembly factor 1 [Blyttiomyces sp. JEL0837]|nr:ATP synthase mitochondrial F1 complex assembly factor 1 [Blyttiomyces sp. JEL0837]